MAETKLDLNYNRSINELYSEMCIAYRRDKKELENVTIICDNCGFTQASHGQNQRCVKNGTFLDTKYFSDKESLLKKIEVGLNLLEQLMALK